MRVGACDAALFLPAVLVGLATGPAAPLEADAWEELVDGAVPLGCSELDVALVVRGSALPVFQLNNAYAGAVLDEGSYDQRAHIREHLQAAVFGP